MSKYLVDSTDMTAIANAIRTKDGTQTTMTVSQMPTRISNIPSGGTDSLESLLNGTLTSYVVPNSVTSIPAYAFYQNSTIQSITFPSTLTSIGNYAFSHAALSGSLVLPSGLTSIGEDAFGNCYGLTSVTFPNISDWNTFAKAEAFYSCRSLTTLINFNIRDAQIPQGIPQYIFSGTALVGDITCPSFTRFNDYCFNNSRSTGLFLIHLTDPDPQNYYFGTGAFNTTHCRLVVPYSEDHSVLAAYQATSYGNICIEESN